MCDITPYAVIGHAENTRLLDVVEDMSRDDWWVRPWKNTIMPMLATTATSTLPTVFTRTETKKDTEGTLHYSVCRANSIFLFSLITFSSRPPLPLPFKSPENSHVYFSSISLSYRQQQKRSHHRKDTFVLSLFPPTLDSNQSHHHSSISNTINQLTRITRKRMTIS